MEYKKFGYIQELDSDVEYIYIKNKNYYKKKNGKYIEMSLDDIKRWVLLLNSPWSDENKYIYARKKYKKDFYIGYYEVIGYEGMGAGIQIEAATREEACLKVLKIFGHLQSMYNVNDDYI